MKDKTKIILFSMGCVTLIIVSIFIWPTVYYYDKTTIGSSTIFLRINRITGAAEALFPDGWVSYGENKLGQKLKPWDGKSITASFIGVRLTNDKKGILFNYYLHNHTDIDYKISNNIGLRLMVKLAKEDAIVEDQYITSDIMNNLFLPAKMVQFVSIKFSLNLPKSITKPEEVEIYLNNNIENLNGFVLFDENHRYKILRLLQNTSQILLRITS